MGKHACCLPSYGKPRASVRKPKPSPTHGIRLRRVEIGMSQADLGDKLGVSFQQVQKYEKGVNRVGANRLQQIASALKTDVNFFYGDETGKGRAARTEIESLLFLDANFSLRLLRAYSSIKDQNVQRRFCLFARKRRWDQFVGVSRFRRHG